MPKILRLTAGAIVLNLQLADDADEGQVATQLEQFVAGRVAEATAPINEQLTAAQAETTALSATLVAETVRLQRLANGELDVATEQAYLEGLPADRLVIEFNRAAKLAPAAPEPTAKDGDVNGPEQFVTVKRGE